MVIQASGGPEIHSDTAREGGGKPLDTQHAGLGECDEWPLKRRPLRTIRGTASLR